MTCTDIQQEHGRSTDFSRWSSQTKPKDPFVIASVMRAQGVCPFSAPEPVVPWEGKHEDIPKNRIYEIFMGSWSEDVRPLGFLSL